MTRGPGTTRMTTGELTSQNLGFLTYKMGLTINNYTPSGRELKETTGVEIIRLNYIAHKGSR